MSTEAMAIVILLLCWVAWIVFLVIHHYAKRKHEAEPAGLCHKDEPTRKQEPRNHPSTKDGPRKGPFPRALY